MVASAALGNVGDSRAIRELDAEAQHLALLIPAAAPRSVGVADHIGIQFILAVADEHQHLEVKALEIGADLRDRDRGTIRPGQDKLERNNPR